MLIGIWFLVFGATLFAMLVATIFQTGLSDTSNILWTIPSIVTGLAFAGYGLYAFFSVRRKPMTEATERLRIRQHSRLVVLAFLAFAGSSVSMGGLYLHEITQTIRQERFAQLAAIAGLKAQVVDKWLLERSAETETAAASISRLQAYESAQDSDHKQLMELLFAEWKAHSPERRSAWLVSPDGHTIAFVGNPPTPAELNATLTAARSSNGIMRIREVDDGNQPDTTRLIFIVPITDVAAKQTTAILAMRVSPDVILFPELDRVEGGGLNEEVGLVRRHGNEAILIKPPKNSPEKSGQVLPLADPRRPAVRALLDGNSIGEGVDYAGEPAFWASHRVDGLPWTVVVKAPQTVIAQPTWRLMGTVGTHLAGSVVVAGLMLFVLWAMQQTEIAYVKARHMEEQAALTKHFERMVLGARDIVLLSDPEGRIIEANPAAAAAYGYSPDEIRKLSVRDLRTEAASASLEAQWKQSDSAKGSVYETVHRRKDGSTFPIEVSNNLIEVNGKTYRQAYIRDITQRRKLEAEIRRLLRVQEALQTANSLMLRAKTEDELYRGMCQAIVEVGGYLMAIVALANDDARRTVRVAAFAGPYAGAQHRHDVRWGEGEYSEGTVGTAMRTGTVQVNQNVAENPDTARWREELASEGVEAYVGLPLRVDGRVIGALAIYSDIPYAFDQAEVEFLKHLADDVSYGVMSLRARQTAADADPRLAT
ncbi:MAG: GAF domain-containing protein [Proteobacteria bacterium]|nr:GAF domain-containing protein [Pseudomonadota bacterium]